MSKKMKLLMENFNKFLQEEDEMEMESDESGIDNILDDILDDMLEEGVLKEMFPTPEDVADGDDIMSEKTPSKEEVKSGIKTALKAPEVKTVLDKIESSAKEKMSDVDPSEVKDEAYARGVKYALNRYGNELLMAAASIPGLGALGALIGATAEPSHGVLYHMSEQAIDAMHRTNTTGGLIVGALIGGAFLASAVRESFKTGKKHADNQNDRLGDLSPEEYEKQVPDYEARKAMEKKS